MTKTARQIVDEALGIDDNEIARIGRLVDEIYPARAPRIRDGIIDHARLLWRRDTDDATARDNVESIARTKPAEFTRATPSPSDYVALVEKERVAKGLGSDAETRMSALRRAQAMTPDELLEAVPFSATSAPAAEKAAPLIGAESDLDTRIERAFGMVPGTLHSLPASKVREYRDAMKKIDAENAPKDSTTPESRLGRPLTPTERMAQYRREQAAKK